MSNPSNQPWREPTEYFRDLLNESLAISRNRNKQALELRQTALKCLDRGAIDTEDYVVICQKNNVPIF